jgi:hypothetical protein
MIFFQFLDCLGLSLLPPRVYFCTISGSGTIWRSEEGDNILLVGSLIDAGGTVSNKAKSLGHCGNQLYNNMGTKQSKLACCELFSFSSLLNILDTGSRLLPKITRKRKRTARRLLYTSSSRQ